LYSPFSRQLRADAGLTRDQVIDTSRRCRREERYVFGPLTVATIVTEVALKPPDPRRVPALIFSPE
jgi:hypothetical protein